MVLTRPLSVLLVTLPLVFGGAPTRTTRTPSTAEIDATLWSVLAASVVHDDIVAMGKTYHANAVLVNRSGTKPIAQALSGWGKDMVAAKKAGTKATVAFKFSNRQDDAESAFESGMFRYATTTRAGVATVHYVHFESLLVKRDGKWVTLMERQMDPATEADWNAMK